MTGSQKKYHLLLCGIIIVMSEINIFYWNNKLLEIRCKHKINEKTFCIKNNIYIWFAIILKLRKIIHFIIFTTFHMLMRVGNSNKKLNIWINFGQGWMLISKGTNSSRLSNHSTHFWTTHSFVFCQKLLWKWVWVFLFLTYITIRNIEK